MPEKRITTRKDKMNVPTFGTSSYNAEFPNWNNGKNDVYHEKHPQFPYYSLPFKGASSYTRNHTDNPMKELKRQQKLLQSHTTTLKVDSYQPAYFEFETTNQKNYKPYTISQRPQTTKPKVEAVKTSAFGQHFDT